MESRYSIKAAARMADLSVDTLRAWERRYAAVEPRRSDTGRRLYSEDEVQRLSLLKRATDLGHPIRMVAPLSDQQLGELLEKAEQSESSDGFLAEQMVDELIESITADEFREFEQLLGRAAVALAPRDLIHSIFFPLLQRVGEKWFEGSLTIAQEHAVSSTLRSLIGAMIRIFPKRSDGPSIVLATLPGERHEFGILLLSLLAASEGASCHYLGPDLPAEEIIRSVAATGSQIVALSVVHRENAERSEAELRKLRGGLMDRVSIWIGGAAAPKLEERFPNAGIFFMNSAAEFERRIKQLKGTTTSWGGANG